MIKYYFKNGEIVSSDIVKITSSYMHFENGDRRHPSNCYSSRETATKNALQRICTASGLSMTQLINFVGKSFEEYPEWFI